LPQRKAAFAASGTLEAKKYEGSPMNTRRILLLVLVAACAGNLHARLPNDIPAAAVIAEMR